MITETMLRFSGHLTFLILIALPLISDKYFNWIFGMIDSALVYIFISFGIAMLVSIICGIYYDKYLLEEENTK